MWWKKTYRRTYRTSRSQRMLFSYRREMGGVLIAAVSLFIFAACFSFNPADNSFLHWHSPKKLYEDTDNGKSYPKESGP